MFFKEIQRFGFLIFKLTFYTSTDILYKILQLMVFYVVFIWLLVSAENVRTNNKKLLVRKTLALYTIFLYLCYRGDNTLSYKFSI